MRYYTWKSNAERGESIYIMKHDSMSLIKRYALIIIGIILTALGISIFYTPNKIVNGGVSGLSTVLYHAIGIQPGVSFAVINVVLLLLALKFLGLQFVKDTILGAALISLFVQLFTYLPPMTSDPMLAAIFGAVLYGFGIGLTLTQGASTGGTDILGRLIQCIFPYVKIGSILMAVDIIVIMISLVVFRTVDLALYGIVSLFLSSLSINWLISKLNVSKLAFVVSDKGIEISKFLVSHSSRGVTILDSVGAYTMKGNKVLMCALKESEITYFQKSILEIDENAFIIFSESQQIIGNGFRVYK